MSGIRGKHTRPERIVREYLHGRGLRYRLHARGLPGRPDLVFRNRKAVVFVNGCFWHQHEGCAKAAKPKQNAEFWQAKLKANVARDARVQAEYERLGWRVFVVWECDTSKRRLAKLAEQIEKLPRYT